MSSAKGDEPARPEDGFVAIDAAGKENPSPSPDSKAAREAKVAFNDEPRLISKAHRLMRAVAFLAFGGICVAFLVSLLLVLNGLFSIEAPILYLLARQGVDWHVWLVVGMTLVIFAAVPLTLAMALVRMISHSEKDDDAKGLQFVTPHIEMLKVCMDALKGIKG